MKDIIRNGWDIILRFASAAASAAMDGGSLPTLMILSAINLITEWIYGVINRKKTENQRSTDATYFALAFVKKLMIFALVFLSGWMDGIAGEAHLIRDGIIGFYLCSEGISLIRNAALLGVPVPRSLEKALNGLQAEKTEN